MPALPEFRDAPGGVGMGKVFLEAKAKHPAQTDGHVAVAGEIEIDLQGIGGHSHPGRDGPGLRQEHPVGQDPHLVCDQNLFRQAVDKAHDPLGKARPCLLPLPELVGDVPIADDRPRDQLRKQRHIGAEREGVDLHLNRVPVHVDHIAHALENIEGDADRQNDLRHCEGLPRQAVQALHEKAGILEGAQDRQIRGDGQRQRQLPPTRPGLARETGDQQPRQVVGRDDRQHQKHVNRLAPGVEQEAEQQQLHIAPAFGAQLCHKEDRRQKEKQKNQIREYHGSLRKQMEKAEKRQEKPAIFIYESVYPFRHGLSTEESRTRRVPRAE